LKIAISFLKSITTSCYFSKNSRRQEESFNGIHWIEDGDRLTVFFNRTDSFQRTGRFFSDWIKTGFLKDLELWFFTETFPKQEEVD